MGLGISEITLRVAARFHRSWSAPKGGWKVFHVTKDDLGDTFTFTPRIPFWTRYADSEDFTTPRVCVSRSLDEALTGLFGHLPTEHIPSGEVFVYATKSTPSLYVPNSEGKPEDLPGNPYTHMWSWKKFAEAKGLDPELRSEDHARTVEGCAPDAGETGEVWSLDPITMQRIGRIWNGEDGRVRAKWSLKRTEEEDVT